VTLWILIPVNDIYKTKEVVEPERNRDKTM